jgi:hypothetical protein
LCALGVFAEKTLCAFLFLARQTAVAIAVELSNQVRSLLLGKLRAAVTFASVTLATRPFATALAFAAFGTRRTVAFAIAFTPTTCCCSRSFTLARV